jgi:hypothetical protein
MKLKLVENYSFHPNYLVTDTIQNKFIKMLKKCLRQYIII